MPKLEDYSDLEIEANAGPVIASSHHLHLPRGYDARKLLARINREALDQLEPGQNLGAFPFSGFSPINTTR